MHQPVDNNSINTHDLSAYFNACHVQLTQYLYYMVHSREVAEELAQETYVRFLRQAEEPRPILDLNAYLFTIASNLARDHLRVIKRENEREYVTLDDDMPDHNLDPEAQVVRQCLENQLQRAISDLPAKTREIFLLYRADELSYKQIASRLDISERTVEHHLHQALLHCRKLLTKA
jgi:RNA polymerase sigma-70 factor (ECF subfamily)